VRLPLLCRGEVSGAVAGFGKALLKSALCFGLRALGRIASYDAGGRRTAAFSSACVGGPHDFPLARRHTAEEKFMAGRPPRCFSLAPRRTVMLGSALDPVSEAFSQLLDWSPFGFRVVAACWGVTTRQECAVSGWNIPVPGANLTWRAGGCCGFGGAVFRGLRGRLLW